MILTAATVAAAALATATAASSSSVALDGVEGPPCCRQHRACRSPCPPERAGRVNDVPFSVSWSLSSGRTIPSRQTGAEARPRGDGKDRRPCLGDVAAEAFNSKPGTGLQLRWSTLQSHASKLPVLKAVKPQD